MLRILLVEDHEPTRDGLLGVLQRLNYDVQPANCVGQALDLVQSQSFDLLISDIDLPDGTGWELRRLVAQHHCLPSIAISGSITDEDVAMSLDVGFKTHLCKPLQAQPLAQAIAQVLGLSHGSCSN